MTDAERIQRRNSLIEEHVALVELIARGVSARLPKVFDIDDLRSVGHVALVGAADRYDPRKGVPFGAWARQRVHGAMIDSVKRHRWDDAMMPSIDHDQAQYSDGNAAARAIEERCDQVVTIQQVEQAIDTLPRRHKRVVREIREGRPHATVAKRLKISKTRVGQIRSVAVVMIRERVLPAA